MTKVWTHPEEGDKITMSFDGDSWRCRCQALGLDAWLDNQSPEDLEIVLLELVSHCKRQGKSNKPKPPQAQSIFGIITSMIEVGLSVTPRTQKVIFETKTQKVSAFHDRDGRLRLIVLTRAGRQVVSEVLAYNPPAAAADDWRLVTRAKQVYEAWVDDAKKDRRPLWHYRAEVDAIMLEKGVDRDAAIEIYQGGNDV